MNFKHGHKTKDGASKLYRIHHNIVQRCTRPKCKMFKYYGGRGINIHEPWLDFSVFEKEIPPCPSDAHTFDRIDNDKGYIPGNVRWATRVEQANNKRNNKMISYNGKTQSLACWARELGIKYYTLKTRINQAKLPPEIASPMPVKTCRKG